MKQLIIEQIRERLSEIAKWEGVKIVYDDLVGTAYLIRFWDGTAEILLKRGMELEEECFWIGHELGHWVGVDPRLGSTVEDYDVVQECKCDKYARDLLTAIRAGNA